MGDSFEQLGFPRFCILLVYAQPSYSCPLFSVVCWDSARMLLSIYVREDKLIGKHSFRRVLKWKKNEPIEERMGTVGTIICIQSMSLEFKLTSDLKDKNKNLSAISVL